MTYLDGAAPTTEQLQALALVGYGHFTSMRVDNQEVRGLSHHLDRLAGDCREMFDSNLDRERVRDLVRQAVSTNGDPSFVVRVTIFAPDLELGHPAIPAAPSVLVTTRPTAPWPVPALRVQSSTYSRDLPNVKHIGLMGAVRHRRRAQLNGFDDALFVDMSGFISEGPTWNVGFSDGQQVIWPSADVLPGVTMRLLKQVHEATVSAPVNLGDLRNMRAAFATNTTIGVRPILQINDIKFPDNQSIVEVLQKEYAEIPPESI